MDEDSVANDILPKDSELVRREKMFLNLFDKFNFDEGSDPELVEEIDFDECTIGESGLDSDQSSSEASDNESEDSFDVEQMSKQLVPAIKERVKSWPEKGIYLQLKTVDPSVSVEEWLEANKECTTTTNKSEKTIIEQKNNTTIITTEKTSTTTSIKSFKLIRKGTVKNDNKEITNESVVDSSAACSKSTRDENANKMHKNTKKENIAKEFRTPEKRIDLTAIIPNVPCTKKLLRSHKLPKSDGISTIQADIVPPEKIENTTEENITKESQMTENRSYSTASIPNIPRIKKLLRSSKPSKVNAISNMQAGNDEPPEKIYRGNTRNKKKAAATEDIPNTAGSHSQIRNDFDQEEISNATNTPQQQQTSSETSCQPYKTQNRSTSSFSKLNQIKRIVIHSPGAVVLLGTKIDEKYMRVTRHDFEKRIDPQYLPISNESSMDESIVPINQRVMYEPPSTTHENNSDCDSDIEDDLLTSYTRAGHFLRADK